MHLHRQQACLPSGSPVLCYVHHALLSGPPLFPSTMRALPAAADTNNISNSCCSLISQTGFKEGSDGPLALPYILTTVLRVVRKVGHRKSDRVTSEAARNESQKIQDLQSDTE